MVVRIFGLKNRKFFRLESKIYATGFTTPQTSNQIDAANFVNKLVSMTWILWALISFPGITLHPGTLLLKTWCDYSALWYFGRQGAIGVIWSFLWLFFVFDSPSTHPRISPQERSYIETSIGPHKKVRCSSYYARASIPLSQCCILHIPPLFHKIYKLSPYFWKLL